MITHEPLFALIFVNPANNGVSVLQLRTNIDPTESHKFRRNDAGELVLQIPPPTMDIGSGPIEELWSYADRFFRRNLSWKYLGDDIYVTKIQDASTS